MKLKCLKYKNGQGVNDSKMHMQTLHVQGLWANALITTYPDKQWKISRPTVTKYAAALMKGDRLCNVVKAAKGRNLSALQQMGYHVSGAMLQKYQNLRPKPKRIRELKVALKLMWEDLPLEPTNKDIKTLHEDSKPVAVLEFLDWGG